MQMACEEREDFADLLAGLSPEQWEQTTIPPKRQQRVLDCALRSPVVRGARRARTIRLVAADLDWVYGSGPELTGPAEALSCHGSTAGRAQSTDRTPESASSPTHLPLSCAINPRPGNATLPVVRASARKVYQSTGTNAPRAASTVGSTGSSPLRPQAPTIRFTTG
jgi:hypothetical protein